MVKILLSIPEQLASRLCSTFPKHQRKEVIIKLIEEEVLRCENMLYECARAVERNSKLRKEMAEWDVTINDGINKN